MCGRLIGRLLGVSCLTQREYHLLGRPIAFVAFRPINPPGPIVAYSTPHPFRCYTCRGTGAVDEIELFSTYVESNAIDALPAKRGRGRPARPFRGQQSRTPLQLALAEL